MRKDRSRGPRYAFSAALLALYSLGVMGVAHAQLQPKIAVSGTNDHPTYLGLKKFAEDVNAGTSGRVNFALFPNHQLGGEVEAAEKIKIGAIEAGALTSSIFSSWIPDVGVIDLPFIYSNTDQALASYPLLLDKFAAKFEAQGFHLVGFTLSGPRDLISSFPINKPEDVVGKKMRVIQNPIHIEMWKLLGANPTPIPSPEVYNSMQTGVIDFFDFAKAFYFSYKYYEVAKYFTNSQHVYALNTWVISNAYWRRLNAADRDVIAKVAAPLMASIHQAVLDYDNEALEKTVPLGAQINTLKDKEPWRNKTAPVWNSFVGSSPERRALVDALVNVRR